MERTENGTDWDKKVDEIMIRNSWSTTYPMSSINAYNAIRLEMKNLLKEKEELHKQEIRDCISLAYIKGYKASSDKPIEKENPNPYRCEYVYCGDVTFKTIKELEEHNKKQHYLEIS